MAEFFKRQFEQIRKATQDPGLGPTGQFPEGKLTQADEGEIRIAVTNYQGKVVIDFGSPVTWIGFAPELAKQLAGSLLEKAGKQGEVWIIEAFIKLCIESLPPGPFNALIDEIIPNLEQARHVDVRSVEELGKEMGIK